MIVNVYVVFYNLYICYLFLKNNFYFLICLEDVCRLEYF